jgi:hypothetical protein
MKGTRLTAGYVAAVRTPDEIADAIRTLTHAQSARLRLVAEKYAWRCQFGPDDLLQEAFLGPWKADENVPRMLMS